MSSTSANREPSELLPTMEEMFGELEEYARKYGLFDIANWYREKSLEMSGGVHRAPRQKV